MNKESQKHLFRHKLLYSLKRIVILARETTLTWKYLLPFSPGLLLKERICTLFYKRQLLYLQGKELWLGNICLPLH